MIWYWLIYGRMPWQTSGTCPRRDVLELALQATRAGLAGFSVGTTLPHVSRGAADRVHNHLADLETSAHCATCNLDFRGR